MYKDIFEQAVAEINKTSYNPATYNEFDTQDGFFHMMLVVVDSRRVYREAVKVSSPAEKEATRKEFFFKVFTQSLSVYKTDQEFEKEIENGAVFI